MPDALGDRADDVGVERLVRHQVDPGEAGRVCVHPGDLVAEVADPVGTGERRQLQGAEDADGA